MAEKVNKAYSMLWLIKRNFKDIGAEAFVTLYKHLIRSHLEYNNSVWSPHKKSDIEKLERVQKRATKMIPGMPKISYPDRLRKLKLPTLTYRRARGDMIETYKLLSGKYDDQASLQLKSTRSPASAGIANRPLVFLGIFLIFGSNTPTWSVENQLHY